ncbi:MAG: hypothetical protein H0U75_02420 [Legionella sp.]|nr:hypothetical protein [Legionella sp.]
MNLLKSIQLTCMASFFLTGLAQALPCDGYVLKVNNKLADNLLVSSISFRGGDIQPGGLQLLKANTTQAFTVNGTSENSMAGHFEFHTLTLKKVRINYTLFNNGDKCDHVFSPVADNDYTVEVSAPHDKIVDYTIINK